MVKTTSNWFKLAKLVHRATLIINWGTPLLVVTLAFARLPWWLGFTPLLLLLCVPYPQHNHLPAATLQAPVRGRWVALNSPATTVPSPGTRMCGQAFAIDLLQPALATAVPKIGWGFRQKRPEQYPCFGQPVFAAQAGTVVKIQAQMVDHRARNTWPGLIWMLTGEAFLRTFGGPRFLVGNHVVLAHADGTYSMYAHLKQGSIQVNVGEQVVQGQQLALVGNSGNTSEPHLHFQLTDAPYFHGAVGLPFRWENYLLTGQKDSRLAREKRKNAIAAVPECGEIFTTITQIQNDLCT